MSILQSWRNPRGLVYSYQGVNNGEADDDCVNEKVDGEKLMVAFVPGDRGRSKPDEIDGVADKIWPS